MAKRVHKPGVYKITNTINGKFYIGSSALNAHRRLDDHKSQLKTNIHPNIHLTRSYLKHGLEVFQFEILEYCENVLEREQYYIDTLNPQYNIERIAGNSFGIKRSKETCRKIGIAKIGNKNKLGLEVTLEVRKAISDTLKEGYKSGRIVHPLLGSKASEKSLAAMRIRAIGNNYRRNNPTYREFYKLDKNTKAIIAKYETARDCINSVGVYKKERASNIMQAIRRNQVAFGFRWYSPNVQVKSGELLENPNKDNQQPS